MAILGDRRPGPTDCDVFVRLLLELHSTFTASKSSEPAVLQTLWDKVVSLGPYRSASCIDLTSPDGSTAGIVATAGDPVAPGLRTRTLEAVVHCAQTRHPVSLVGEGSDIPDSNPETALFLPLIVDQARNLVIMVHARDRDGFVPHESDSLLLAAKQCGLALGLRHERRAKQAALSQLNLQRAILDNAAEGIIVTDHEGTILSVNPAVCRVTGYGTDELLGQKPRVFRSGVHDAAFYDDMWAAIYSAGTWKGEIWNKRKSGEACPEWFSISAIRNARQEVEYYTSIFTGISYQKEIEKKLRFQASHDPLTGLANRQLFQESLERALPHTRLDDRIVAILLLDLDHFKPVNDTLGRVVKSTRWQKPPGELRPGSWRQSCRNASR